MAKYIDIDKAQDKIIELIELEYGYGGIDSDIDRIFSEISVADVTPVIHAEWELEVPAIAMLGFYSCSNCGTVVDIDERFEWNYCPHCGAKMDGGSQ